jgi:hypothetical protein
MNDIVASDDVMAAARQRYHLPCRSKDDSLHTNRSDRPNLLPDCAGALEGND